MNKNKNFNKQATENVNMKEAAKKANKMVDFDKIPRTEPKFNIPSMASLMIAALNSGGTTINKDEFHSSDEIVTKVVPEIMDTIKILSKELCDLIDKKVTPEMIKTFKEVWIETEEKKTELELMKLEKGLELRERLLAIKEREHEFEMKKFEFEERKKEEV